LFQPIEAMESFDEYSHQPKLAVDGEKETFWMSKPNVEHNWIKVSF